MKSIFMFCGFSLFSFSAFAEPRCTDVPKSQWKSESEFQEKMKAEGYKIKKFKVTKSNCYEIYGWGKDGKKVEIYFNPSTFEAVESKTW